MGRLKLGGKPKLSNLAIFGIIIGVIALILAIFLPIYFLVIKKKKKDDKKRAVTVKKLKEAQILLAELKAKSKINATNEKILNLEGIIVSLKRIILDKNEAEYFSVSIKDKLKALGHNQVEIGDLEDLLGIDDLNTIGEKQLSSKLDPIVKYKDELSKFRLTKALLFSEELSHDLSSTGILGPLIYLNEEIIVDYFKDLEDLILGKKTDLKILTDNHNNKLVSLFIRNLLRQITYIGKHKTRVIDFNRLHSDKCFIYDNYNYDSKCTQYESEDEAFRLYYTLIFNLDKRMDGDKKIINDRIEKIHKTYNKINNMLEDTNTTASPQPTVSSNIDKIGYSAEDNFVTFMVQVSKLINKLDNNFSYSSDNINTTTTNTSNNPSDEEIINYFKNTLTLILYFVTEIINYRPKITGTENLEQFTFDTFRYHYNNTIYESNSKKIKNNCLSKITNKLNKQVKFNTMNIKTMNIKTAGDNIFNNIFSDLTEVLDTCNVDQKTKSFIQSKKSGSEMIDYLLKKSVFKMT